MSVPKLVYKEIRDITKRKLFGDDILIIEDIDLLDNSYASTNQEDFTVIVFFCVESGMFEDVVFEFSIVFPENYPHERCYPIYRGQIYHPNLQGYGAGSKGNVCLYLDEEEGINLEKIIYGLRYLLYHPGNDTYKDENGYTSESISKNPGVIKPKNVNFKDFVLKGCKTIIDDNTENNKIIIDAVAHIIPEIKDIVNTKWYKDGLKIVKTVTGENRYIMTISSCHEEQALLIALRKLPISYEYPTFYTRETPNIHFYDKNVIMQDTKIQVVEKVKSLDSKNNVVYGIIKELHNYNISWTFDYTFVHDCMLMISRTEDVDYVEVQFTNGQMFKLESGNIVTTDTHVLDFSENNRIKIYNIKLLLINVAVLRNVDKIHPANPACRFFFKKDIHPKDLFNIKFDIVLSYNSIMFQEPTIKNMIHNKTDPVIPMDFKKFLKQIDTFDNVDVISLTGCPFTDS